MSNVKYPKRLQIQLTEKEYAEVEKYKGQHSWSAWGREAILEKLERTKTGLSNVKPIKAAISGAPLEDVFIRDTVKAINHLKEKVDAQEASVSDLEDLKKRVTDLELQVSKISKK